MALGKISLTIVSIVFLASCSSSRVAEKSTGTAPVNSETSNVSQQQNNTQPAPAENSNSLKVSKYKTSAE